MAYKYTPPKFVGIRTSRADILDEFSRWNAQAGEDVITDYDLPYAKDGALAADVVFVLRGQRTHMKIDAWPTFAQNLKCAALNIRDMRLIEARGGLSAMREALLMLPEAGESAAMRDPYAVLGGNLNSSTPMNIVEAFYLGRVKAAHPDVRPPVERRQAEYETSQLNNAIEAIRKTRAKVGAR